MATTKVRLRVLGRVNFGDSIPKLEGGWYNELTGEWGDIIETSKREAKGKKFPANNP